MRFALTVVFAFVGCSGQSGTQLEIVPNGELRSSPSVDHDVFDIDQHRGEGQVVEGTLEGNFLLSQSGEEFGVTHKGRDPMRIRFQSVPLALSGETDEIAHQLLGNGGNRVRIIGTIARLKVEGRGPLPGGQAGYSGPIPAHILYYMIVSSCEPINSTPGQKSVR